MLGFSPKLAHLDSKLWKMSDTFKQYAEHVEYSS